MIHPVQDVLRSWSRERPVGLYSACTANELAIETCVDRAKVSGGLLLIEATANQVNQSGGYTGMTPNDFARFAYGIVDRCGLFRDRVVLGGDHLGPLAWTALPAEKAMSAARELIRLYVLAGFTKIHLDTSMSLADDDKSRELGTEVIASRAAELAVVAEQAYRELRASGREGPPLIYVIGSEVPIPGGAKDTEELEVTDPDAFERSVSEFKKTFERAGLQDAWGRVVATVVQPGVEFGDESIHEYDRCAALKLTGRLKNHPGMVLEGHSTDYQQAVKMKEMVEDGISILKVGPALTYALREGLFALELIERELLSGNENSLSSLSDILEQEMIGAPQYWESHYHGTAEQLRIKRKFSYSDRCRYYLPLPSVSAAIDCMFRNLADKRIPDTLLSQYMPYQYTLVRSGELDSNPRSLVKAHVARCINDYLYATRPGL